MPKFTIRHPEKEELFDAMKLIFRSANDLRIKAGRKPWELTVSEVPPLFYHLYDHDRDGHWAAYSDNKMIGYGSAIMRGRQWYLADLFVDPRFQTKGVGSQVLQKCLEYGKGKADSYSLATFSYNEAAVGLYSAFGMVAQFPILEMYKKIGRPENIPSTSLKVEFDSSRIALSRINKLEKDIRGYTRFADWHFFSRASEHIICSFYSGTTWVGYSLIIKNNLIAPAGAVHKKYLPDIVQESVRVCLNGKTKLIRIWVGGPNSEIYQRLAQMGFRINELLVFHSTRQYSDLQRYLPANLTIY